jgi:hypothetical protein
MNFADAPSGTNLSEMPHNFSGMPELFSEKQQEKWPKETALMNFKQNYR